MIRLVLILALAAWIAVSLWLSLTALQANGQVAVDCVDETGFVTCPPEDVECAQVCWGDVNGDGQITADELVTAVTNAVNGCPRPTPFGPLPCWGSASNWNRTVTISDLMLVANEALDGCCPQCCRRPGGETIP